MLLLQFFLPQCQTFSWRNPLFCHFFQVSNFFLLKRVRLHLSVENFLSHGAEYFRRETFLSFRKVPILGKITDKRGCEKHDFASKLFFLKTKMVLTGAILCF